MGLCLNGRTLRARGTLEGMEDLLVVREWDPDRFHAKVRDLEGQGYVARRDTYQIKAEMDPETGKIIHLHSIELYKPKPTT